MAVEGFVGWHGQGKTYNAVRHCLLDLRAQRRRRQDVVFATNAIVVGAVEVSELLADPPAHPPKSLHFETWDELVAVIGLAVDHHWRMILLIDEAGKFLAARFYQKLDPRMLMLLQERRKVGAGVDLYFTAPAFGHVDSVLRDVCQVVHKCRRFGGTEYSHDGGKPPKWFLVKSYRPEAFFNTQGAATARRARPIRRRLVAFAPELASLYTTGIVSMHKPMAAQLEQEPEYRPADDQKAVTNVAVGVAVGGRRRRK